MFTKDPYEAKYQFLLKKKREISGLKHFNDPKAFVEYSNDMQDVYKNIDEYSPGEKRKILIVFDDMIVDMINRKINISFAFITQSYFKVLKDLRLNFTYFFIMKIPNKRKL